MNKKFYSKILLFGEYSVIKDSMGLSVPYDLFEGELKFGHEKGRDSELYAFSQYMKRHAKNGTLGFNFDADAFEFDVGQGLIFDSTIPQGFGVGSSGALCAAVFDRYADNTAKECDYAKIRAYLSIMESHFHGSSSGVDPLNIYLNKPLLLRGKGKIETAELPIFKSGKGGMFLLSTGRARKTEPLVNLFLEKCKAPSFESFCHEQLAPLTNICIESFLSADTEELFKKVRELSEYQLEYFRPMIPKLFLEIWEKGLESDDFCLKLCGAGGGGFLIGFTKDYEKARESLSQYELRALYRF